jgi:glycogen debranching enzyme
MTTTPPPPGATTIQIDGRWYVLATGARAEEQPHALKRDALFAVFDRRGDIVPWEGGDQGLYLEDTRYLSHCELLLDGARPLHLNSAVKQDGSVQVVELMNPDLQRGGVVAVPKGTVHLVRRKRLVDGLCHETLRLANHGLEPVHLTLTLQFAADHADLFEVRGMQRDRHGDHAPVEIGPDRLTFGYTGLDHRHRRTVVQFVEGTVTQLGAEGARFEIDLAPGQRTERQWQVACLADDRDVPAMRSLGESDRSGMRGVRTEVPGRCRIVSSNPMMNRWLERSASDLEMVTTQLPTGPFPFAGVPWYCTTFGRDGLLTAHQCLWLRPELARGVLSFLASTQATEEDPATDAEPGKILHEARACEMAATREVPFARYYGSIDSTPLFVVLAHAYWQRTGDLAYLRQLWPHVQAALQWIDRYGDRDGDGYVEYARRSSDGLIQQGWKDSHDSVFHADGRMASPTIALCEVQGYVHAAKLGAAAMAEALGQAQDGQRWRTEAAALQARFVRDFWSDRLRLYVLALDGDKRPCDVPTSNAGHCLWSGIASPEHARVMAERLLEPDLFSGWGVRTLGEGQVRYNPMSYHNGSIWPHDNALVCEGLARYGQTDAALALLTAAFDTSLQFEDSRLPELFCGFPRRDGEGPTRYPVACSPQAWASGSLFGMLAGCLGITFTPGGRRLALQAPRLPEFVDWLRIEDLAVGDARVDLLLQRWRDSVGVEVTRRVGEVDVVVQV